MPRKKKTSSESFQVNGDQLLEFVRKAYKEGNVRRIVIKDAKGKVYMEIPVNIGVLSFFLAPPIIALAAVAAMVGVFEVEIIRRK